MPAGLLFISETEKLLVVLANPPETGAAGPQAGCSSAAYARPYPTSNERARQLEPWTHTCNWHRPHGILKANTPSKLSLPKEQPVRLHG